MKDRKKAIREFQKRHPALDQLARVLLSGNKDEITFNRYKGKHGEVEKKDNCSTVNSHLL